jgi:predicted metal-binding membrane protein
MPGLPLFVPVMSALISACWIALWVWEQSPYGRYLDHGRWTDIGFAGSICSALPGGAVLLPALLYAGGWVLMSAAMMLPTTLPLMNIFRRITDAWTDRAVLLVLLGAGYLFAWSVFGVGAHLFDVLLHRALQAQEWLLLTVGRWECWCSRWLDYFSSAG